VEGELKDRVRRLLDSRGSRRPSAPAPH
jgi:hypothetical protein